MHREDELNRYVRLALIVLALVYAALAGFRTVGDFDLGWQLAAGRYVVQHREIPSSDVLSYTAQGREWIYPPFSGVLFYLLHALGGYAALSWLSAAACAGTIGLLLLAGRAGLATAALAIIAVPAVAYRTVPRADLFTTILFAGLLAILWRAHCGQRTPLWMLPVLMVAWVNLHLGFVAGLALLAAYAGLEAVEMLFAGRRAPAGMRLRRAAPWLAAGAVATLINPWGPRLYAAIARQNRALELHSYFLGEWSGSRLSLATVDDLLAWRGGDSSFWWLLAAAVAAAIVLLRRREPAPALLLLGAGYLGFRYIRFQALFAAVAVVAAGAALGACRPNRKRSVERFAAVALLAAMVWLAGVRVSDLLSSRYYLAGGELALFGTGASWWYPERATAFLLRERLPGNVFHDYNLGGYLAWRLAPQYPVYIDGRAVPFGAPLFFRHRALMQEPPESPEWQREAGRRRINTLIFSVARYAGLGSIPLELFCESQAWRPVYLDEVAVIFVRNSSENAALIDRLKIDCSTVPLTPPADLTSHASSRNAAELFNFYANAGSVLYVLARDSESAAALERAGKIFPLDGNLHLAKAQLYQANNRVREAEREYRTAVQLKPTDAAWYALGRLYASQGRFPQAAEAIEKAAGRSFHAYDRYRALGQVYLAMERPRLALEAFDKAKRFSPFRGEAAAPGAEFRAQVAVGRARAWRALGDLDRAARFQEAALRDTPRDAARWMELADLYQALGRADNAQQARRRAAELRAP